MERILLVAESKETLHEITSLLGLRYQIESVPSAQQARRKIDDNNYHLILIETQLPDSDGFKLCAIFRSNERTQITPIILIDSEIMPNPHARATAFSVGANDLVRQPINATEFLAEISAKIHFRNIMSRNVSKSIRGPFQIDLEAQKVYLNQNDNVTDVDLTPIEFKLFVLFTNNENQPQSREKIRTAIWGAAVHIESRSIDKHISSLRKKIAPFDECIQTTPGLGYSFSFNHKANQRTSSI